MNKWYMQKPESIIENETHEIFWVLEIQSDDLMSAIKADLGIIYKKKKWKRTLRILDFAVPLPTSKNQRK